MDSQRSQATFRYTATICKDFSSLNTKIAFLTFKKLKLSYLHETFIIALEYLQLISQIIWMHHNFNENTNDQENFLVKGVIAVAKLLNPTSWLLLSDRIGIKIAVLTVYGIYFTAKYSVLLYIILTAIQETKGKTYFINAWAYLVSIQSRVVYLLSSSLWVTLASKALEGDLNFFGIGKTEVIAISTLMMVIEVIFSFVIEFRFCHILPSKSLLSSKDNRTEIINLFQKFFLQILQIVLNQGLLARWIFISINTLFSFAREVHFFTVLPNYNITALGCKAVFSALIISLNVSAVVEIIISSVDYETDMSFFIIMWAITSLIIVKASLGYLDKIMIGLILNKKRSSPELLLHKIYITKYFRKLCKTPGSFNGKCLYSYLINTTVDANLKTIFSLQDSVAKRSANEIYLEYLENLSMNRFSNSSMVKLQIAYFYARKLHLYSRAMRVISELQRAHPYVYSLNASLLIYNMQNSLRTKYMNKDSDIDFSTYLKSRAQVAQMKEKIIKQAELQIKVYQEILGDHPDLENILQLSQRVNSLRKDLEKKVKSLFNVIPECYVKPLLVVAEYYFTLNFSMNQRNYYYKRHAQMLKKYEKYFKSEKLSQENLYQDDNVFFLVAIDKASDAGKVAFVTKSVEKMYGGEASLYIGTDVVQTAAPSSRSFYSGFFKNLAETGDNSLIGRPSRGYGYHRDGYVVEVDFYMNIHPYMTRGFYLGIMMKPIPPSGKDYLLLLENGDIDVATKDISEKLGLLRPNEANMSKKINVKLISEKLSRINEAFNIMAKKEDKPNYSGTNEAVKSNTFSPQSFKAKDWLLEKSMKSNQKILSYEEALELYEKYTSEEAEITLSPVIDQTENNAKKSDEKNCFVYRCQVQNTPYGPIFLKTVTLEPFRDCSQDDLERYLIKEEKEPEPKAFQQLKYKSSTLNFPEPARIDIEESGDFKSEDENEAGPSRSRETQIVTRQLTPFSNRDPLTSEGCLLSPATVDIQTLDSNLLKPKRLNSQKAKYYQSNLYESLEKVQPVKRENEPVKEKDNLNGGSKYSRASKSSQQARIASVFEKSLAAKSYPTHLIVIYLLFFVVVIGTLMGQLILKMNLEKVIKNIEAINGVVSGFELKNFFLISTQLASLNLWRIGTEGGGKLDLSPFPNSLESHAQALKGSLEGLTDTNTNLLLSTDYLDDKAHDIVFGSDVRIFDSYYDEPEQAYMVLDNFLATDRIVEVGLKGVSKILSNITNAKVEIRFLLRNSVNDILVKNEMISDTFVSSLYAERSNIKNLLVEYISIIMGLTGIQILVLLILIRKQYNTEKYITLAIIQINKQDINNLLEEVISFKRMIENEGPIENRYLTKDPFGFRIRPRAKKENLVSPTFRKKQRRYTLYVCKLLLLVTILVWTFVWYNISTQISIDILYTKQSELYFVQRLKSTAYLTGTMSQDLITGNGTTMNHNILTPQIITTSINDMRMLRNRASAAFMNKDSSHDYEIGAILFASGCFSLKGISREFCNKLEDASKKTNLINLLSELESLLMGRKEKFDLSNRTRESLVSLESEDFYSIFFILNVIISECDAIISLVNNGFNENLTSAKNQGNFFFGMFFLASVGTAILTWILLLRDLKETNNKLKKALQLFPATLVLSNFTLKTFLIETSKGALELIKNHL